MLVMEKGFKRSRRRRMRKGVQGWDRRVYKAS